MSESYGSPYSSTALMSIMGSVQAVVFALCVDRDLSLWKLGWNIRLLTVAYSVSLSSFRDSFEASEKPNIWAPIHLMSCNVLILCIRSLGINYLQLD